MIRLPLMRRLKIAGLVILGLGVAVRVVLPFAIARVLEDQVARATPFQLEIDDVDLSLISGKALIERATLSAPTTTEEKGPQLRLKDLEFAIDWREIASGRVQLHELALRGAALRAGQNKEGVIDWLSTFQEWQAASVDDPVEEVEEPEAADGDPLHVGLSRIALKPLDLELRHGPSGRVFRQSIDVEVQDFVLGEDFELQVTSSGDLGGLVVSGRIRPEPIEIQLKIESEGLDVDGIRDLRDDPVLALAEGTLALSLDLSARTRTDDAAGSGDDAGAATGALEIEVSGTVSIEGGALAAPDAGVSKLSFGKFALDIGKLAVISKDGELAVDVKAEVDVSDLASELTVAAPDAGVSRLSFASLGIGIDQLTAVSRDDELAVDVNGAVDVSGLASELGPAASASGVSTLSFASLGIEVSQLAVTSKDSELAVDMKGEVDVSDLASELAVAAGDGLTVEALAFESLGVPIDGVALPGPEIALGRVVLAKPRLALRRSNPVPEPAPDAAPEESVAASGDGDADAPAESTEAPEEASLRLQLAALELRGGRVRIEDETLEPDHSLQFAGLSVDLEKLLLPGRNGGTDIGQVEVRVASLGREPLVARASLAGPRIDASVLGKEVDLEPFGPYAAAAGGYAIPKGRLSADIEADIEAAIDGASIDAPIGLVFHDLALRQVSQKAALGKLFEQVGVSVTTALALLRDSKGRIKLKIPLKTGAAGTTVGLASIVRDGLIQALTVALTSPLKLAGVAVGQFQRGEESPGLATVPFDAGASAIGDEGEDALTVVARLLANRPGLRVFLQSAATRADHRAIAERLGTPLPEGGEAIAAPLAPEMRDALAALVSERIAAAKAALANHPDLAVEESHLSARPMPVPDSAPLAPGNARVEVHLDTLALSTAETG